MSKHVIFLVHGMGDFNEGWSSEVSKGYDKSIQDMIKEKHQMWPQVSWRDFNQNFEFCEINYNHVFEGLREKWKQGSDDFLESLKSLGLGDADTIFNEFSDFAEKPSGDDFLRTHVLDVLLYRFTQNTAGIVRAEVTTQILARLEIMFQQGGNSWSIIAHSLGTSVIHDTLHEMYNKDYANNEMADKLGKITYPDGLVMLSNVSRVLESDYPVYKSMVSPGAPTRNTSACRCYANIRNAWDPISAVKKFNPSDKWPDIDVRKLDLYKEEVLKMIAPPTPMAVHDFEHYLNNPRCSAAVIGALYANMSLIPEDTIKEKHQIYINGIEERWQQEAIDKVLEYSLKEGEDNLALVFSAWAAFRGDRG